MPAFSPVHYAALEAESATRKLATATKRRRSHGTPKPGEMALNAYNIARTLKHLQEALTGLAEEHGTLAPEIPGITPESLQEAAAHLSKAITALPATTPTLN